MFHEVSIRYMHVHLGLETSVAFVLFVRKFKYD